MNKNELYKLTDQIISEKIRNKRFYPESKGDIFSVSSCSRWIDKKWILDGKTVGGSWNSVTINWDIELPDGSSLLDEQHMNLLDDTRHLLWSLLVDRRNGRAIKTTGMSGITTSIRMLLRWMMSRNYFRFSELDNRASERYVEWLAETYADPSRRELATIDQDLFDFDEEETCVDIDSKNSLESELEDLDGITSGVVFTHLRIWKYLWEQRDALQSAGIDSIQEQPFGGITTYQMAAKLVTKATDRIPAIPDAVAIPLMNAAQRFVSVAAKDLMWMIPRACQARQDIESNFSRAVVTDKVNNALNEFSFSIPDGEAEPWHNPLDQSNEIAINQLRNILDDLIDACLIIVQSESGMRVGEISSLLAGSDPKSGLPSCIELTTSKSGMLDLYYVKATLSKMKTTPTTEKWLLAACPRGSRELPVAVHALDVIQKILAPFRSMMTDDSKKYLFITIKAPNSLPKGASGLSPPSNRIIGHGLKKFASKYVEWSEIVDNTENSPYIFSKGACLRTHQWRKTYAQFVFQVDRRLLPAIARQFKHLSLAMTEGAYLGTSTSLVTGIADHNRMMTVDLVLANARGHAPLQEGRLGKLMAEYQAQLASIIAGKNDADAREAIVIWCDNRQLQLFFHGYGKCIPALAPLEPECHRKAKTVHWANKAPNYATREPSVCTGCYLFMAGTEAIGYWSNRYVENMSSWLDAEARGEGKIFRVAKARADQSLNYLTKLGANIPEIGRGD